MMDLDSAIQHCKEQVQEQAKKGCYRCAEEHHQLAEWLKELKEYREERRMKLLIDIPEHIYEHAKETTEDSRDEFDAMRAIANGTQQESRSEIPNTCGDAISREELIEALDTWDKFGYAPTNELVPLRGNVDKDKYVPYIHYDDVIECIKGMPSVTPQQRSGQWIQKEEEGDAEPFIIWECSECHGYQRKQTAYCPDCGSKMEVEE